MKWLYIAIFIFLILFFSITNGKADTNSNCILVGEISGAVQKDRQNYDSTLYEYLNAVDEELPPLSMSNVILKQIAVRVFNNYDRSKSPLAVKEKETSKCLWSNPEEYSS